MILAPKNKIKIQMQKQKQSKRFRNDSKQRNAFRNEETTFRSDVAEREGGECTTISPCLSFYAFSWLQAIERSFNDFYQCLPMLVGFSFPEINIKRTRRVRVVSPLFCGLLR